MEPKDNIALCAIEESLQLIALVDDEDEYIDKFNEYSISIERALGFDDKTRDPSYDALFDERIDQDSKRFIATCLLRLLDTNSLITSLKPINAKMFKLFDSVFEHDLYKDLKIDVGEQNYQKESKIKGIINNIEYELNETISSLDSLERIINFRQRLMKIISRNISKSLRG